MLREARAPYVLSRVDLDGHVERVFCESRSDVEIYLSEWDIDIENIRAELETVFQERETVKVIVTDGRAVSRRQGKIKLVLERIVAGMTVVVFGAGHVGKAVAELALLMGWNVIVIDDRREFLDLIDDSIGRVQKIARGFESALDEMAFTRNTAMVIVTRGHQFDEVCLEFCLRTEAFYVGMIGSRRRVRSILNELNGKGTLARRVEEIHAPIGLEIAARTPQEIAVSIVAEIIREKNLNRDTDAGRVRTGSEI
jgi:xanthine dehydrogenase accessory factor